MILISLFSMIINDFLTALQFLTRIKLYKQTHWSMEGFGRSVKFFPLVGAIIGIILVSAYNLIDAYLPMLSYYLPSHMLAAILVALPIIITGGLHCDGYMDTMDSILSGKQTERMLEIMKDSRVGAHGVTAFILLILVKWSLLLDMPRDNIPLALFVMPLLARLAMVIGITCFPYARPEGIGKAFAQYSTKKSLFVAIIFTILLVAPLGKTAVISAATIVIFAVLLSSYITRLLGGLTGDIYGALSELAEVIVLITFLFK